MNIGIKANLNLIKTGNPVAFAYTNTTNNKDTKDKNMLGSGFICEL
jgi:hypothetical protein